MAGNTIFMVSASPYELAWVSKLPLVALAGLKQLAPDDKTANNGTKQLNILLDNLVRQQHSDGSWGSQAHSPGDRLLNTLAALTAFAYNQFRWEGQYPASYVQSMRLAISWLQQQGEYNPERDDQADLAGIELLVTALKEELVELGLAVGTSANSCEEAEVEDALTRKAKAKLGLVPQELIFEVGSTLSHAIEFTGKLSNPPAHQFSVVVAPNGSVGNSPSATAFTLQYAWEHLSPENCTNMVAYLDQSMVTSRSWGQSQQVGWPVTYPVNYFLEIWYKYYVKQMQSRSNNRSWSRDGVATVGTAELVRRGFGAGAFFAEDADTTATYLHLTAKELVKSGQIARLWSLVEALQGFYNEKKGYFFTYPYEMTPSLTTNAHAWQALNSVIELLAPTSFRDSYATELARLIRLRNQVGIFIKSKTVNHTFWHDKWHMSPTYATYHVVASGVIARDEDGHAAINRVMEWLVANQSKLNGGWGFVHTRNGEEKGKSNPDETFHALLLLLYGWRYYSNPQQFPSEGKTTATVNILPRVLASIKQGTAYLEEVVQTLPSNQWPAMWCDKTLYCPYGMLHELARELVEQLTLLTTKGGLSDDYDEERLIG